jgi:small subunit ribosomal protein S16
VAVRIRLQRKGARHMAFFRIVAADSRSPRDGRFIEQLGHYDPLRDPPEIKVDTDKAIGWLSKGAQPSETVKALFARVGILETWHEVRKGKSLDELRHIEDEARKRIEAQAAMDRRRKAAEAKEKAERKAEPEKKDEPEKPAPADDEAAEAGGEKAAAEPAAEEPAVVTEEEVQAAAKSEDVPGAGATGGEEAAEPKEAASGDKQSE